MFHFIWVLIIGAVIGAIAGAITKTAYGWIGNIVAGIVGSWLGESLLGSWGPSVAGMAIFPSLIGAVILVFIASLVFRGMAKR
ncbi:GlsB/YeaQ/YmgE family stress response membrane protein [Brochothrix thermosphacta]|uniref:GlsB/YeaQ/YmgE family stress response membrane protein n=1 Tax=Brochothrix thermosphacta TaxID=2756 RepID=UPI00083FB573|nr:GlsB/YeaQ/YmgE family stress response membrane protein [Brochothrix thermosphacta]ODJ58315.1 hypothetical protein BFR44_09135 [Brochothrix thermosphacta]